MVTAALVGAGIVGAQEAVPNAVIEQRGQRMLAFLREGLEHGWPGGLPESVPADVWIYPGKPTVPPQPIPAALAVVVREQPDPEGRAWIGYADGHLELVEGEAALTDATTQVERAIRLLGASPGQSAPDEEPTVADDARLSLEVVDAQGAPIEGAAVGVFYNGTDMPGRSSKLHASGKAADTPETRTGADGRIELAYAELFPEEYRQWTTVQPLYALHEGRRLAGLDILTPNDFRAGSKRLVLHPATRVAGELGSLELTGAGSKLTWTNTLVSFHPQHRLRPMQFHSLNQRFEFLLPPGAYLIDSYGTSVYSTSRVVELAPGQTDLSLRLDLCAKRTALLTGKPAPELRGIKGWKNGGPVTIEELRGKVVLLDFWGYWCGPCIASMPELMKLHEELAGRGLMVIAIHDDSVADVAEMDQKLVMAREEYWGGRDLPFLVALDGGGETPVPGSARTARGATTAAYGIDSFPTTLLVNKQGILVGEVHVQAPGVREQIERLLAE